MSITSPTVRRDVRHAILADLEATVCGASFHGAEEVHAEASRLRHSLEYWPGEPTMDQLDRCRGKERQLARRLREVKASHA